MLRSAGRLPTRQNSSLRSSDKPLRTAAFRQNAALRNITVFSHGSEHPYTASPKRQEKAGARGRRRYKGAVNCNLVVELISYKQKNL